MVRKSQTGFVYRGNTEHRGRSQGIREMGSSDRAFLPALRGSGARRDRSVIFVQVRNRDVKGGAGEAARFWLLETLIDYV